MIQAVELSVDDYKNLFTFLGLYIPDINSKIKYKRYISQGGFGQTYEIVNSKNEKFAAKSISIKNDNEKDHY